jgi:hypothetical protein
MILEDKVDALVADMPACTLAVLRYPEANLSTLSAPFTVDESLRIQWLESGD